MTIRTKRLFFLVSVFFSLFILPCAPLSVEAGTDAASVPADRIPWSGYWWPLYKGELVNGYRGHPSPLEKYDAVRYGSYPSSAMKEVYEEEYDPTAYTWYGHCDDWAASSVLEEEPAFPGDLNGVPFFVGDKKGLLTLLYDGRVVPIMYGRRYNGEGDDLSDIPPGGASGFHQVLIDYIAVQGLPIIMDTSADVQVWNYPAYRYEMNWYDAGGRRHVTCEVWFADDGVKPDDTGTRSFTRTYEYYLAVDGDGNILDEPGAWVGDSIAYHPDFLWFPVYTAGSNRFDEAKVREILECEVVESDDIFEPNNSRNEAHAVASLEEGAHCAAGKDDDWYAFPLQEGDDFFMDLDPYEGGTLAFQIQDPSWTSCAIPSVGGAVMEDAPSTGWYACLIRPLSSSWIPYSFSFRQSPFSLLGHLALGNGWETRLILHNRDQDARAIRMNGFDDLGRRIFADELPIDAGARSVISLTGVLGDEASVRNMKIISREGNVAPRGYATYEQGDQSVCLPLSIPPSETFCIPHVAVGQGWWTGIALMNGDAVREANVALLARDERGTFLGAWSALLPAGGSMVQAAEAFFDEEIRERTAWLEGESDRPLTGFVLWGNHAIKTNPGLAGIPLISAPSMARNLYIPYIPAISDGWWTGVSLVNPGSEGLLVITRGYDGNGVVIRTGQITLGAKSRWVGLAQGLFSEWDPSVHWIEVEAPQPILGFAIYGLGSEELAAFILPGNRDLGTNFSLLSMETSEAGPWKGIIVLNPGKAKANIYAEPYDAGGNRLLPDRYFFFNPPEGCGPKRNGVAILENFFPGIPPDAASYRITSSSPIWGMGLVGNHGEGWMDRLYFDP